MLDTIAIDVKNGMNLIDQREALNTLQKKTHA
jgi:hypothetical protein